MKNRHLSIILSLLFLALAAATAQDNEPKDQAKPPKSGELKKVEKEIGKGKDIMVMETSMGTIELKLYAKEAPKTVQNFIGLAKKGYYNGIIFHRVIENFMIQGGDPTGTGTGGESIYGQKFEDEISPNLKFERPGLLAMANAGPNTNGSQFFITLVPTQWLNGKHTIFGEVVSGMDVVKAIGKVEVSKSGNKPIKDVVMKKVYLKGAKEEKKPKPSKDAKEGKEKEGKD